MEKLALYLNVFFGLINSAGVVIIQREYVFPFYTDCIISVRLKRGR